MKMTLILVLMASILVGCKTASQVAYDMGFSSEFISAIGGQNHQAPERVQVQPSRQMPRQSQWDLARMSQWDLARMEKAKAGQDQVLERYRYLDVGEVEHVLTYAEINGQGHYVVNALISEYDKPLGRTPICSMNFDRFNGTYFREKVRNKLVEMFPPVQKSNPQMY